MLEVPDSEDNKYGGDLQPHARAQRRRDKVKYRARQQDSEIQRGEIMVQEKLSSHEEEWCIVQHPADEEESTEGVVFDHFGWIGKAYN